MKKTTLEQPITIFTIALLVGFWLTGVCVCVCVGVAHLERGRDGVGVDEPVSDGVRQPDGGHARPQPGVQGEVGQHVAGAGGQDQQFYG